MISMIKSISNSINKKIIIIILIKNIYNSIINLITMAKNIILMV